MDDFLKTNLTYDAETGDLFWVKPNGNSRKVGTPIGTTNNRGYKVIGFTYEGKSKNLYCHRLAWFLHYNIWPDGNLDHVNGEKRDNRISNLRQVTQLQNCHNSKKSKLCSSVYKGVSWSKVVGGWHSYITLQGKRKHLGYFSNEEDAAKTYDQAALENFGVYAKLNFPDNQRG